MNTLTIEVLERVLASFEVNGELAKSLVVLVTPDAARRMRDTMHFDRQRKIKQAIIDRLTGEIVKGRFIPAYQVYIARLPNGKFAILNGNHTLEAVAAGHPQVLTLTFARMTDKEAGWHYSEFDTQSMRTWRESLDAIGRPDEHKIEGKVTQAIGYILGRFRGNIKNVARNVRYEKLNEYVDAHTRYALTVRPLADQRAKRYLERAAVFAVVLETFKYQADKAEEFWTSFAMRGRELTDGDPELAFWNYIDGLKRNSRIGGREGLSVSGGKIEQLIMRAAALAWNAFYANKTLNKCQPAHTRDFKLYGTPWENGTREAFDDDDDTDEARL
jgi:hypothetical protein